MEDGDPVIEDDVACLIQQINILFDTTPGDLIGDTNYGTDYRKYLYDLKLGADQLKEIMTQDILSLDLLGFTPVVEVYLMQGTEQDIALIQVDLYRSGEHYTRSYKIE